MSIDFVNSDRDDTQGLPASSRDVKTVPQEMMAESAHGTESPDGKIASEPGKTESENRPRVPQEMMAESAHGNNKAEEMGDE